MLRLVEYFSDTQISNFDAVVLGEEHVDGLDVAVEHLVGVEVVHT